MSFTATRNVNAWFDLGANASSQGLRLDNPPPVPLQTTLVFDFSFGVDHLTDGDFFLRAGGQGPSPLQLQAKVEDKTVLPDFEIVAGFTQPMVQNGTVSLDAGLDVALGNPDGQPDLSIDELKGNLDALVTFTRYGDAEATLPLKVDFLEFSQGGDPRVVLIDNAPFDETAPTITLSDDFTPIAETSDRVAEALRQGFGALADLAADLNTTDKLAEPIFLVVARSVTSLTSVRSSKRILRRR